MNETSKPDAARWTGWERNGAYVWAPGNYVPFNRETRQLNRISFQVYAQAAGGAVEGEAEDTAARIISSVAACRALPDPESDVAALRSLLQNLVDAVDGVDSSAPFPMLREEAISTAVHVSIKARRLLARLV